MEEPRDCPDCGVLPGVPHEAGCDVARCLRTGMQRIQCGMDIPLFTSLGILHDWLPAKPPHPGEDCGQDTWTGGWPGVADCIRLGWYSYWMPGSDPCFVRCGRDHPGAGPDLNRLNPLHARWDRTKLRWEAPGD